MIKKTTRLFPVLAALLSLAVALGAGEPNGGDSRLPLLADYARRVLVECADTEHTPATPLLVNGINPTTKEWLEWRFGNGTTATLSNLASQQNFLRFLVGLSAVTGDPVYAERARSTFRYYFDHQCDGEGLLHWGGHRFVDLKTLKLVGPLRKKLKHELKNTLPFYELMAEVDATATARYIEAFWLEHVQDWDGLTINRHGEENVRGRVDWESGLTREGEPLRDCPGLTFLNTGNDMIYAAVQLYRRTGDVHQLGQAKRLASMYHRARHPTTKLGAYQYNSPVVERPPRPGEDRTKSIFGDRAQQQFGPEFGSEVREYSVLFKGQARTIYVNNALVSLEIHRLIGKDWPELLPRTEEGLCAYVRHAYDRRTRMLRPLLTDGRDLTDVVLARDGYYGPKGAQMKQHPVDGGYVLALARCYALTRSAETWGCVRELAPALNLRCLPERAESEFTVPERVLCDDALMLIALVDLHAATGVAAYRELAERIAANIVRLRLRDGFFMAPGHNGFANIDALEPYALLYLEASRRGVLDRIPAYVGSAGYTQGDYVGDDGVCRDVVEGSLY